MRLILTAALFLLGLLFAVIGIGFLINPASSAAGFGLTATDSSGLAALRADFTAFFVVGGGCIMLGTWRRNGAILLVPAALFAIAFVGRAVSIVADGTVPLFWTGMAMEAMTVAACLIAWSRLPRKTAV